MSTYTTTAIALPTGNLIDRYGDGHLSFPSCSDDVIIIGGSGHSPGYTLLYVGPGLEARLKAGGPMVPGPHLFLVQKCAVIDNHGGSAAARRRAEETGTATYIAIGDIVSIFGHKFTVEAQGHHHVQCTPVAR